MLLTNWLKSLTSRYRTARSRRPRNQHSRSRHRYQPALSRRPIGIEELEDRTLLTSMISIDDVSEWEGDLWYSKTDFIFTVTRTGMTPGDLNQELMIDFSTQDGTATLNDYQAQSGSIVFSADAISTSQSKTIVVQVERDIEVETDEFFEVILSTNNVDVTFENNTGAGTILDDDIMVLDQAGRILPPESAVAGDHFGNAIAIDGDFMVVGAIESDLIATDAGAAYVYFRNRQNTPDNDFDDVWEYQATLTAFDAAENDQFGCSVAIDGDTIVIGAYQDNGREFRSGTAYVYRWDGTNWNYEDKLIASDGRFNDNFGGDVTIEGDVIVIGASEKNPSIPNAPFYVAWAGQAYVFTRTGSDWSETQIITAPNLDTSDQFGWRVELENNTLFISGLKSDLEDSTVDQGAVFVYENINGVWTVQQTLVVPDGETNDLFGYDLDVDGNILGVVSGALDESRRKAYVFEKRDGTWEYSDDLGTPGSGATESADSISVSGNSIAVGSILSDGYRSETGIVTIYHRKPLENHWSRSEEIFADYGYSDDYFGYAVAYTDSQLIIGTPQAPDSTRNPGQLYIFEPHRPEVSFELSFQGTREDVSGQTAVRLSVVRSSDRSVGALNFDSTIYYHTVDGTATAADGDYQAQSGSITFTGYPNAGRQIESFTIYVNDDDEFEGFEEFYVQLTEDTGDVLLYYDRAEIFIFDNDYANVNVGNVTVDEDAGMAMVDVTLDQNIDTEVSVDYSTSDISALESSDYTATSGTLVFEPGVLSKTVAIPLVNTDEIEGDETFALTLSNLQVSGALVQIGVNPGIITIKDDEEASLTVSDVSVDENAGTASVVVTLDQPVDTTLTLDFATADLSAVATSDYSAQSGTLTFNPGELTQTITIPIVDSGQVELNESFLVNLSNLQTNGAKVTLTDNQVEVSINDDDQAKLTIADVTVNEKDGTADITVSLDRPVAGDISVEFTTADQTALDTEDYASLSGTVFFAADQQSKTITIPLINNELIEVDERFLINLSQLQNHGFHVVLADAQAEVTIEDDEKARFSIADIDVNEADGTAVLNVTLDTPLPVTVTVDFTTSNLTAVSPDDYQSTSGTLTFLPGELSQTITIDIVDSDLLEIDETFLVTLSNLQSGTANIILGDSQAEVTIHDNDQASLTIDDVTVDENAGSVLLTVSLDQVVGDTISIDYATADQSAVADDDYASQTGTLTFAPGVLTQTISIPIVDSDLVELEEAFLVNLSNLQTNGWNVSLTDAQAVVTISDDDQAQLTIEDISINEAEGTAEVTVSLDQPVAAEISVFFETADQTAVAGEDYEGQSGTITFSAGQQTRIISIPLIDTNLVEPDEQFLINLSQLQNNGYDVVLADSQAEVTIRDNDQAQFTIDDIIVSEADGTAVLTVSLSHPVTSTVTIDYATADDSALSSEDYLAQTGTLTFLPGVQSQSITIDLINSDPIELDERFLVNLSNIQAGSADVVTGDHQGEVTIQDNEQSQLIVSDLTINEADGTAEVVVTLDQPVNFEVRVNYSLSDGKAKYSLDYQSQSGTLTFAPGEQSKTITVALIDNDKVEEIEDFHVNLSGLNIQSDVVIIGRSQADVSIVDDDQAQFSITDITVDEAAGIARLYIYLTDTVYANISVDYSTVDQSAVSDSDYLAKSGRLTFTQGQTAKSLTITITNDQIVEGLESFYVQLSNIQANGAQLTFASDSGEVTIEDNDEANLTMSDVTVDESAGVALVSLTLDQPVQATVSLDFNTLDQSALANADYQPTAGTVTFQPGEVSQTVSIPLIDTDLVELTESFLVQFTNLQAGGANIALSRNRSEVTVTDDDQSNISIDDIAVNESAANVQVTVSLDAPVDAPVVINYATASQTAQSPSDYAHRSGSLTFTPGTQTQTISIPIVDSGLLEIDETFLVILSGLQASGRNVILADDRAVVTILDDDSASAEVKLRVVSSPTPTQPDGSIIQLPEHETWLSEWATWWTEIWVQANDQTSQGSISVDVDLSYNSAVASAMEIEYGPRFSTNQAGDIDDSAGTITGLYAETSTAGLQVNRRTLFARIRFTPQAQDQIDLDLNEKVLPAEDLELQANSIEVQLSNAVPFVTPIEAIPAVQIYANPYDLNNDDAINFRDLILFAGVYNSTPSQSDSDYAWFADLNQDDRVHFQDLLLFASNYGKSKANQSIVTYPSNFPDAWNQFLVADTSSAPQQTATPLTQTVATTSFSRIVDQVSDSLSEEQNVMLEATTVQVVDLEGDALGRVAGGTIYIDVDAAGYGWYLEGSPAADFNFVYDSDLSLIALPGSDADGRFDLQTVLFHELGHLLGYEHSEDGVMQDTLAPGIRLLPDWELNFEFDQGLSLDDTDGFFLDIQDETELMPFK